MNYCSLLVLIILNINNIISNGRCLKLESIIGGNLANETHPINYQVSVQINNIPRCGGGVIAEQFIITVAHCVADENTGVIADSHVTVIISYNALHPDPTVRRFELNKVYLPKTFIGANRHANSGKNFEEGDIAVIKLESEIGLAENSNVSKLELAGSNFSYLRKFFIISGHGTTDMKIYRNSENGNMFTIRYSDGKLRYAVAESVSRYNCSQLHSKAIHSSNMCAKIVQRNVEKPEGVCVGDSGSPLVYNGNMLVAILDSGCSDCNETIKPAIYTRISYHLSFIRNALKDKRTSAMRIALVLKNINLYPTLVEI